MRREEEGSESGLGIPVGEDGLEDGKDAPAEKGEADSGTSGPDIACIVGEEGNDAREGELGEGEEQLGGLRVPLVEGEDGDDGHGGEDGGKGSDRLRGRMVGISVLFSSIASWTRT